MLAAAKQGVSKSEETLEIDLTDASYRALANSADRIANLLKSKRAQSNPDLLGTLDDFLGVVYALIYAKLGGFTDRPDNPIDIEAAVKRAEQIAAGQVRASGKWMAGFHFNSALFRTSAVYHRILKIVADCRKGNVPILRDKAKRLYRQWKNGEWWSDNVDKVHEQVNSLKHDPEGTYHRREVQYQEVVSAVGELLDLMEAWGNVS